MRTFLSFTSGESGLNLRSGISTAAATNEIASPYALPNIYGARGVADDRPACA